MCKVVVLTAAVSWHCVVANREASCLVRCRIRRGFLALLAHHRHMNLALQNEGNEESSVVFLKETHGNVWKQMGAPHMKSQHAPTITDFYPHFSECNSPWNQPSRPWNVHAKETCVSVWLCMLEERGSTKGLRIKILHQQVSTSDLSLQNPGETVMEFETSVIETFQLKWHAENNVQGISISSFDSWFHQVCHLYSEHI